MILDEKSEKEPGSGHIEESAPVFTLPSAAHGKAEKSLQVTVPEGEK